VIVWRNHTTDAEIAAAGTAMESAVDAST